MGRANLVLFWRRGVFVDLENRYVVVVVVKSEENAEIGFGRDLHVQNITVKFLVGSMSRILGPQVLLVQLAASFSQGCL